MEKEIIREIDVQNVMTKSSLPVGGAQSILMWVVLMLVSTAMLHS